MILCGRKRLQPCSIWETSRDGQKNSALEPFWSPLAEIKLRTGSGKLDYIALNDGLAFLVQSG